MRCVCHEVTSHVFETSGLGYVEKRGYGPSRVQRTGRHDQVGVPELDLTLADRANRRLRQYATEFRVTNQFLNRCPCGEGLQVEQRPCGPVGAEHARIFREGHHALRHTVDERLNPVAFLSEFRKPAGELFREAIESRCELVQLWNPGVGRGATIELPTGHML